MERLLWLVVAVVTLAGIVLIGAIMRSGPEPGAGPPLADAAGVEASGAGVEASGAGGDDSEAGEASERAPPGQGDAGAPDGNTGSAAGGQPTSGRPGTGPTADDPAADGAHASAEPGEGSAAGGEAETPAGTSGGAPAGWSEVARGFGRAFTRTSVGQEAWFAAMSSWLTPEQAAVYRDVPIDDVPTGELIEVEVSEPGGASHTRGTLTYDNGMVLEIGLSHVESAGGWLVARVSLAGSMAN